MATAPNPATVSAARSTARRMFAPSLADVDPLRVPVTRCVRPVALPQRRRVAVVVDRIVGERRVHREEDRVRRAEVTERHVAARCDPFLVRRADGLEATETVTVMRLVVSDMLAVADRAVVEALAVHRRAQAVAAGVLTRVVLI